MMFMKVDLPDPEGPITATISPAVIVRLTPARARTTESPMRYSLTRSRTASSGSATLGVLRRAAGARRRVGPAGRCRRSAGR